MPCWVLSDGRSGGVGRLLSLLCSSVLFSFGELVWEQEVAVGYLLSVLLLTPFLVVVLQDLLIFFIVNLY